MKHLKLLVGTVICTDLAGHHYPVIFQNNAPQREVYNKGRVYYVTITTAIFSHAKTCYIHV